ncbi:MAG: HAD-IIB family hydrolase [Patescibacteria group bacterium]
MVHTSPKLVVFDIDETLTESKTMIDNEMANLLSRLAERVQVAIVSGAALPQCLEQVVEPLDVAPEKRGNIFIIPTSGAALYTYEDNDWQPLYALSLTQNEKKQIYDAFELAFAATGFDAHAPTIKGNLIEDRGTQITFSALGGDAPRAFKKDWDPNFSKRTRLIVELTPLLTEFSIKMGGTTSIDVTRKGVDKAYGLGRLMKHLNRLPEEVLYIGDALFEGGNDSSVLSLHIPVLSVSDLGLIDTKEAIRGLLSQKE